MEIVRISRGTSLLSFLNRIDCAAGRLTRKVCLPGEPWGCARTIIDTGITAISIEKGLSISSTDRYAVAARLHRSVMGVVVTVKYHVRGGLYARNPIE